MNASTSLRLLALPAAALVFLLVSGCDSEDKTTTPPAQDHTDHEDHGGHDGHDEDDHEDHEEHGDHDDHEEHGSVAPISPAATALARSHQ